MKKLLILGIMLMLVSAMVLASNDNENERSNDDSTDDSVDDSNDSTDDSQDVEIEDEKEDHSSEVTGLENAILRVRKNETKDHLEEVLKKIQEKRAEQFKKLQELHNLTVEEDDSMPDTSVATGVKDEKLLGWFKVKYEHKYIIDEQTGEMTRVKKWYDFAYPNLEE